jgi:alkane 1-monooxygenase
MKRNLDYLWSLTPGCVVIAGNLAGGWWGSANIFYSLVVLAVAEWFMKPDISNDYSTDSFLPDAILFAHVLMQVFSLGSFFYAVHTGLFSGWQFAGAAASVGIHSGSSSIVIAHELIHRKSPIYQLTGKFLLFTTGNIYFFVEHLRVHHKWVGTVKDPATAKYGESVYRFFFRTTYGQITDAMKIETARLKSENRFPFGLSNYVVASVVFLLLFLSVIYFLLGMKCVLLFTMQAMIANFLLEYTNYIEHYGLVREENERVNETHSWQSDKPTSRFFLIDLSRHSDHHNYASKPYHTLDSYETSPVLPGGYVTAIYLALIPPLWFRVVHARMNITK